MTNRKNMQPGADVTRGWDRAAKALAARLGWRDSSVRHLTRKIAHAAWWRRYYAGQPEMLKRETFEPDLRTVLDALALIPAARYAVDVDERDLIRAARHLGASWEAIGVTLGAKQSGARQTARGRYERLGGDVNAAVPGDAAEEAPALVDAGERVEVVTPPERLQPADVPAAMFVEPTLLDVDQAVTS